MTGVIFRADANPHLGFGHLMRCRALAHTLKGMGARCVMVGPPTAYQNSTDLELFEQWYPVNQWVDEYSDAVQFLSHAKYHKCDRTILDDFRIKSTYQKTLLGNNIRWLQFDGQGRTDLWADWVHNASPAAREEQYSSLLKGSRQKLLLGPEYAILRQEFQTSNEKKISRENAFRILLTFGGGDDRHAILFVLSALYSSVTHGTFVIITGKNNPNIPDIKKWIRENDTGRVELHISPNNVSQIMKSCSFAIMSGGTSTFEAVASGLPMIIITIADNQIRQANGWEKLEVGYYIGSINECTSAAVNGAVDELIKNYNSMLSVVESMSYIKNGTTKVAEHVLGAD